MAQRVKHLASSLPWHGQSLTRALLRAVSAAKPTKTKPKPRGKKFLPCVVAQCPWRASNEALELTRLGQQEGW